MIAPRFGLPARMAHSLLSLFNREGEEKHAGKLSVIDALLADQDRIPLDAGEGAIFHMAAKMAQECRAVFVGVNSATQPEFIRMRIDSICNRMGIAYPYPHDDAQAWARVLDQQFWVRALRKEHGRRLENTAIRLGLVGEMIDPYITREGAARQAARNEENRKRLEQTEIYCEATKQTITLAQAADSGMANLANRRNELMTRIRGFEEIATELGHRGLFVTMTAPSKYHAGKDGRNEKYAGFTPREAQAYLCAVWARIRAALAREGIAVYGFRVAEPHTDGCPHWHLLLFVPRAQMRRLRTIIRAYSLAEDGDEKGAKKNRVKLIGMNSSKGTASGYISKYIAKNIDGKTAAGQTIGEHKSYTEDENGQLAGLRNTVTGGDFLPAERVRYWAQKHGIRQFQQIGGAPVGVWRELRRIQEDAIQSAPAVVREAWAAVQKTDTGTKDENGKPVFVQADWKRYCMAQGGPAVGRDGAIKLWKREIYIDGRYGRYEAEMPCGVYAICADEPFLIPSVRYEWKRVESAAVALDLPWTGVNNCTVQAEKDAALAVMGSKFVVPKTSEWAGRELKKFDPAVDWAGIEDGSKALDKATKKFAEGPRRIPYQYKPETRAGHV